MKLKMSFVTPMMMFQFTGSLVDHLYVDLSVCAGRGILAAVPMFTGAVWLIIFRYVVALMPSVVYALSMRPKSPIASWLPASRPYDHRPCRSAAPPDGRAVLPVPAPARSRVPPSPLRDPCCAWSCGCSAPAVRTVRPVRQARVQAFVLVPIFHVAHGIAALAQAQVHAVPVVSQWA